MCNCKKSLTKRYIELKWIGPDWIIHGRQAYCSWLLLSQQLFGFEHSSLDSKRKQLALSYLVVVRLSLDSRLGHLAMRLSVLAVVVELVLGLVEECSDEVEDAVVSHVRPKFSHMFEASK
jgi:hypothetical protein